MKRYKPFWKKGDSMNTFYFRALCVVFFAQASIEAMEDGKIQELNRYYTSHYDIGHAMEWSIEQSDGLTCLAYSPSTLHPFFVSGSEDHSVCLWFENRTCHCWLAGEQPVSALAVSPDCTEIAVGTLIHGPDDSALVTLYEAQSGLEKLRVKLCVENYHGGVTDLSYGPDGSTGIAVMHDGSSYIWGHQTSRPIDRFAVKNKSISSARIMAKNLLRFVTCNGKVFTMPMQASHLLSKQDLLESIVTPHVVVGRPLLSCDGNECIVSFIEHIARESTRARVGIFDFLDGSYMKIDDAQGVAQASFSHDRSTCISIFRRLLTVVRKVADPDKQQINGALVDQWRPSNSITATALSPDGSHLATCMNPHMIALWRLRCVKRNDASDIHEEKKPQQQ